MGVVNVTPDSFSDGNLHFAPDAAIAHAEQLFDDGATMVDIGAESTRPNATLLTSEEEWRRLAPVLAAVLAAHPGAISLDSHHPETIKRAVAAFGPVFLMNDVTGFNNPDMVTTAAYYRLGCIVSHMPSQFGADIQAAHQGPLITDMRQVKDELLERYAALVATGVPSDRIILDPGIGFGKTPELNRALLEFPKQLPEHQVLIGYSRKRFLGDARFDLAPNLAAGQVAVSAGATILRVHDVAGHRRLT